MRKTLISGMVVALALAGQSSERSSDVDRVAWRLQRLAQEGGEEERTTAILALEALARQYRRQAEETPPIINEFGLEQLKPDVNRCWSMLGVLASIGDRRILPLFEEMTASTERYIRFTAVRGYIAVAGLVDSLPFIGRLMENPLYTNHERALFLIDIRRRLEASPPSPEDMEKICALMLERSLVEEGAATAELDKILSVHLPGYSTSVQRQNLAERMINFDGVGTRGHFVNAKQEISKVPVQERKDFRAKGELLDPERKGK